MKCRASLARQRLFIRGPLQLTVVVGSWVGSKVAANALERQITDSTWTSTPFTELPPIKTAKETEGPEERRKNSTS